MQSQDNSFEFGSFRVEVAERRLFRNGEPVAVRDKIFDTLLILLENRGRLVSKEAIMERIWPSVVVDESSINHAISVLRKTLGDGSDGQRFIETVPKHGYRFAAATPRSAAATPKRRTRDVRWAAAAMVLVVSCFVALRTVEPSPRRIHSVAVLPFAVISSSSEQDYLGTGMAQALAARLTAQRSLDVRPPRRTAATRNPLESGRDLHVDAIIDGQLQIIGDRLRASVQLFSVPEGNALWSGTFDERVLNLFHLEDAIATAVLQVPVLGIRGIASSKRGTSDPAAYEEYLKGRFYWNKRTRGDFDRAVGHFRRAITIDPNYAEAYSGLADAACMSKRVAECKRAAFRARDLDDSLAAAHTSLGHVYFFHEWNWGTAEFEFRRAIELDPSYATAHHWLAFLLASQQRFDEAIAEAETARRLDPLSSIITTDLGQILFYAGRREDALKMYRRAVELDPHFVQAHQALAEAYESKENFTAAADERLLAGLNDLRDAARHGAADYWRQRIAEKADGYMKARALARSGEVDSALSELERLLRARDGNLIALTIDPAFARLNTQPRFRSLRERLGL